MGNNFDPVKDRGRSFSGQNLRDHTEKDNGQNKEKSYSGLTAFVSHRFSLTPESDFEDRATRSSYQKDLGGQTESVGGNFDPVKDRERSFSGQNLRDHTEKDNGQNKEKSYSGLTAFVSHRFSLTPESDFEDRAARSSYQKDLGGQTESVGNNFDL